MSQADMTAEYGDAELIKTLEAVYDLDSGFLGLLRQGVLDEAGLDNLIRLLGSIEQGDEPVIGRRLVALLWMIPTLMTWQVPRVVEQDGDAAQLQRGIDRVQEILSGLLGTP